jgi:hypothetical protein
MKTIGRQVAAGVFALAGAAASAAELSYGVDVGVGYDDNVVRIADSEQDDTIATLGAQLSLSHESSRIDANIASRLEYRDYLDDSFGSELLGNLIADSRFEFIEERLTWVLEDTFGQSTRNQLAPDTPDNRESMNLLSTGPELELPLGSRNSLLLSGRYVDMYYEDSDLGNDRIRGEVSLQRELSGASTISLSGVTEQVTFDESLYPDFDRSEAFLGYEIRAARTQITAQGGITEITSGQSEGFDDWLARLRISRQASSALTVGLELGHEISDAGNSFAQQQGVQPGDLDPVSVQQTSSPFLNEYLEVFGTFMRNRTSFDFRAGHYEETYQDMPLFDRERLSLDLSAQRSLSPMLTAQATANYSRSEYTATGREFSEIRATLGARWSLGRASSINVEYAYLDRSDDVSAVDFNANQLWLRFAYIVGEGASGGSSAGP